MRRLMIPLMAILFLGVTACTNSGKKGNNSSNKDSSQTTNMQQQDESSEMGQNKLPAVPADASVSFKNLKDGQTVTSPFQVEMGVKNMKVEPSGEVHKGFGHHHIIVDHGDFVEKGKVIPADSTHIHFGDGQTETELDLTPGKHKLTLQFADGIHRSYGKQLAKSITVNVKK